MANLTANRTDRDRGYKDKTLSALMAGSLPFYRGGALAIDLDDPTDEGYVVKTLDGSVPATFFGGSQREKSAVTLAGDGRIGIFRDGSFSFHCTAATQKWVGKKAFFLDDHTVSIIPPNADNPVIAGIVVGIISSAEVEVLLTPSDLVNWCHLGVFCGATLVTSINANSVEAMTDFLFDNRVFIHEFATFEQTAIGAADLVVNVQVDAVDHEQTISQAGTVGTVAVTAVNRIAEPDTAVSLILSSAGEPTGEVMVNIKYTNLF